eukprot:2607347-Rhodomonas_salina.1
MVDLKVYSRNQKYRLPLSSKISDTTGTTLRPEGAVMSRRAFLQALVTFLAPDDTAIWIPGLPQT